MLRNSHIDMSKLNKVPSGHPFEYNSVVSDDFPVSEHSVGGIAFRQEVDNGVYENVVVYKDKDSHIVYKKL